ncbi:MAG: D-alanyl-D-alanine carboxypeptidase/D-alanyl-D-alanine-endopeptidase [Phycisphaerae bacterium]
MHRSPFVSFEWLRSPCRPLPDDRGSDGSDFPVARPPRLTRSAIVACAAIYLAARLLAQPPDVAGRLSALVDRDNGRKTAVFVRDLRSGDVWFDHNADRPLKPASVQKLFTTAAALERFGPAFRFETRLYVIGDELVVIGAGDPSIGDDRLLARAGRSLDQLWDDWSAALRARGVSSLRGIALDDSVFDRQWTHPDWPADQALEWYQAPVGAFNLNDNCLDVRIERSKSGIQLRLLPMLPDDLIVNQLSPGGRHAPTLRRRLDSDVFVLAGPVSRSHTFEPMSVGDPTVFFAHALQAAFRKRGIALGDSLVRKQFDAAELPAASLVARHHTPLADVMWRSNTFSQNLFAECVSKSLAAYEPDGRRTGTPGSWEQGRSVMISTLGRIGVHLDGATFRDGSGLSHNNRVTARQIVDVLTAMDRHAARDVFYESLAAAGELGSMKNRYAALRGRVRGKTGTLRDVHALAGYVTRDDGTRLAFAVLVNGSSWEVTERVGRVLAGVP